MRCMLCGTANLEDAHQCNQCGSDLSKEARPFLSGRSTPAPTILVANAPQPVKSDVGTKTEYMVSGSDADIAGSRESADEATGYKSAMKTQYISPDDPAAVASQVSHKRKLVGFLVSYTWNDSGDAFGLYEGKNSFGSSHAVDSPIPSDRAMSAEHFVVMVRGGRIKIKDSTTTNATMVDGVEIWGDSADANHGSRIKAGETEFILTLIP